MHLQYNGSEIQWVAIQNLPGNFNIDICDLTIYKSTIRMLISNKITKEGCVLYWCLFYQPWKNKKCN